MEALLLNHLLPVSVSVLNPASPEGSAILRLWNVSIWVCGLVLAIVTTSIGYIIVRFRKRDDAEPRQITGNTKLEIAWTVGPVLLVTLLFVLSIMTARAVDHPVRRDPDVVVIGHQWWWEVRYPAANVITAGEVHLPVGRKMLIAIESADVVHDFWAPRLSRKIDAIPGRRNFIWIEADSPEEYNGFCAEYCGPEHAWMLFRVMAEDESAYDAWLSAQSAAASEHGSVEAQRGRSRFGQLTCANCHNIRGVNQQNQYAPDLTHMGSRKLLASGRLTNTADHLREWLHEPNIVKPNCLMPNLHLSNDDLGALTAYLESLQ